MSKNTFFISALFVLLLASLAANSVLFYRLYQSQQVFEEKRENGRIMAFRNMFSEKVLLAEKEIDFDTRLALETSVRSLDDPEILAGWQEFTICEAKEDATAAAKKLLKLLINKTAY